MRKLICLAAVTVLGGFVYAGQAGYSRSDGPNLTTCERALRLLGKGDRAGFDVLFELWPDRSDSGKSTIQECAEAQAPVIRQHVKSLGEFHGFELVRAEEVGSFLRRYTYVCRYERGLMRWSFNFYRRTDEWFLRDYHFDGDEERLISDLAHDLPLEGIVTSIADRPEAAPSR